MNCRPSARELRGGLLAGLGMRVVELGGCDSGEEARSGQLAAVVAQSRVGVAGSPVDQCPNEGSQGEGGESHADRPGAEDGRQGSYSDESADGHGEGCATLGEFGSFGLEPWVEQLAAGCWRPGVRR